jgi:hypothetical protein
MHNKDKNARDMGYVAKSVIQNYLIVMSSDLSKLGAYKYKANYDS